MIAGGTCAPHGSFPSPLVKEALPEPGTGAAFPGGYLTASWYRSALIERQDARLLGSPSSSPKSGQRELAREGCWKLTAFTRTPYSQAHPLEGIGSLTC